MIVKFAMKFWPLSWRAPSKDARKTITTHHTKKTDYLSLVTGIRIIYIEYGNQYILQLLVFSSVL